MFWEVRSSVLNRLYLSKHICIFILNKGFMIFLWTITKVCFVEVMKPKNVMGHLDLVEFFYIYFGEALLVVPFVLKMPGR